LPEGRHIFIYRSINEGQCKHHIKISTISTKPDEARKKSFNRSIKELKESDEIAESSSKYLIVT
jgi:hypothetical protein